ncbi:MAG: T9SS type A sorting domain-containing protein [Bacteroidetes bacterium]|nr:T9SS type A sorting domain-containing protein [Bacteroidota bacterium]
MQIIFNFVYIFSIYNITIEASQQTTIEITNMQGQMTRAIGANDNKTNIDVSTFQSGIYFIKVKSEKGVMVKKLVKE